MPEVTPTPTNTGKKSHVWLWVLLIILILIALGVVTCTWAFKVIFTPSNIEVSLNTNTSVPSFAVNTQLTNPRDEASITDSDLGWALLASEDVTNIALLEEVRPSLIELNDHLDNLPPENYSFFVGRSWSTVPEGELKLGTALVKNASAADAQNFVQVRSADQTVLSNPPKLGDSVVMYYEPASEGTSASVTVRFTQGSIAAKVQVFATGGGVYSDSELQAGLSSVAKAVAQAQANRLTSFLDNTLDGPEQTASLSKTPTTLVGGTFVGSVPVTEEEWLGVTGDFSQAADISGLMDGALSRFSVDARPEEVAEVTVLQFLTNSLAESFKSDLLNDLESTGSTEVVLSGDLAEAADAVVSESVAEIQIVQDNFVIDLTIFSPFGEFDMEAAQADVVTMGQDLLTNFSVQ